MRIPSALRTGVLIASVLPRLLSQEKGAPVESKGMPPRSAPTDYQAHAQAGAITIAADFTGHSIATLQGTLSTEDYVVIETGIFGAPEEKIKLSPEDFTLRINDKKTPLPSQSYVLVVRSVKDPEWEPPVPPAPKSKTGFSGGGSGGQGESSGPPPPVKVPLEVQRALAQRVQKAALPEGDRTLPQAGLLFFPYRGKAQSIHSVELIYAGPAGKATLSLQP